MTYVFSHKDLQTFNYHLCLTSVQSVTLTIYNIVFAWTFFNLNFIFTVSKIFFTFHDKNKSQKACNLGFLWLVTLIFTRLENTKHPKHTLIIEKTMLLKAAHNRYEFTLSLKKKYQNILVEMLKTKKNFLYF